MSKSSSMGRWGLIVAAGLLILGGLFTFGTPGNIDTTDSDSDSDSGTQDDGHEIVVDDYARMVAIESGSPLGKCTENSTPSCLAPSQAGDACVLDDEGGQGRCVWSREYDGGDPVCKCLFIPEGIHVEGWRKLETQ
jgi:hypothetical protein